MPVCPVVLLRCLVPTLRTATPLTSLLQVMGTSMKDMRWILGTGLAL